MMIQDYRDNIADEHDLVYYIDNDDLDNRTQDDGKYKVKKNF